jgi:cell wall-associated NlpC family hydrolase
MGVPNGGTTGALNRAKEATQNMTKEAKKMADEFTRAAKAAGALPGAGSSNFSVGNLTTSGTFTNTGANAVGGMGTMSGFGGMVKAGMQFAGTVAGSAMGMMPTVQDAVSMQLGLSQAKFFGLQGGAGAVRGAMSQGTMNSPTDMMQAISIGNAGGLMPGMPGYNGLMNGVSQLSNITGSASSAMQATLTMDSARNVNRLRSFGINVRTASGGMRAPGAIFKDIAGLVERQTGNKLTKAGIAKSMQPGQGLYNLIKDLSGGDQETFQALQGSLMQFAGGGDLSRASTTKSGMTTAASNAQSDLNTSEFNKTAAAADPMAAGFTSAAGILTKVNNGLASIVSENKAVAGALKLAAGAETLAASSLGAAAMGIMSAVQAFVGSAMLGRGGVPGAGMPLGAAGKAGMSPGMKLGLGAVAVQGGNILYQNTIGKDASQGTKDKVNGVAGVASMALTGAAIGTMFGGPGVGTAIGGFIGGGIGLAQNWGSLFGGSGNGYGADPTSDSSSAGQPNVQAGLSAVAVASTQIGIPYSWGGGSIQGPTRGINQGSSTVGFDCSSLVVFVMSRLGISMPRTAREQQRVGQQINPKDAQPGDLLFWGNPAHHVAIYAGGGMMIHAPSTGKNIERKAVNLAACTSATRVINAKTGSADTGNLLGGGTNPLGGAGEGGGSFPAAIGSALTPEALRGVSASAAMGSAEAGGSGLGFGSETGGPDNRPSAMAMASISSSMVLNKSTGKLEHSTNGGTVINYGGVTIPISVKDAVSAKEVGKIVKEELSKLSINAKVVNS